MSEPKSHAVTDFDRPHAGPNGLDDPHTFVAQDLACLQVVFISSADAGCEGLDEDFVVFEVARDFVADDLALGRAAEDIVG